jgi:predicted SAM-dependent methyltransferase
MILLNLGCGGNRPIDSNWVNIDNLHVVFPDVTCPERLNLDAEKNYINVNLINGLPFEDNSVNGILASHIIEHLDCHETVKFLKECRRVLMTGGVLRISVPDPEIFHQLTIENCDDWGEPNYELPKSFMEYALFWHEHKQLVGKDSVFCFLWMAGFRNYVVSKYKHSILPKLGDLDNRPKFSLFIEGVK